MFQDLAPLAAGGAVTDGLPANDADQLGALLLRLEPRLRAVALRYTRDADSAADVLQNAFEKVVRHAARFRGASAVSTWMHRIVVNEALMWLRSERRHARRRNDGIDVERVAVADPAAAAPDLIAAHQARARLAAAIGRLAPAERLVIDCCAIGGESYRAFARRSGVDSTAVKSRAFRARRKLETALRDDESPAQPSRARSAGTSARKARPRCESASFAAAGSSARLTSPTAKIGS